MSNEFEMKGKEVSVAFFRCYPAIRLQELREAARTSSHRPAVRWFGSEISINESLQRLGVQRSVTFMTVLLNVVYDGYQTFIREVK
jgi:hypothetical protein